MLDGFGQFLGRLADYNPLEVAIELAVLWVIVYIIYHFVRGTRAAGALKGLILLLILSTLLFRILAQGQLLPRLTVLHDVFLGLVSIALIVTFQPELRRALMRLGETSFFRGPQTEIAPVIDALVKAAEFLSKNKFGAIIAVERSVGLRETIESGRPLNADVSAYLLNAIFWPNAPLHDMGVVIRGSKVLAAGVQFPLAEPADMPTTHLGTRHRAAVGLARMSDALVVVVSEETGAISLAEGRQLQRWLTPEALRRELTARLNVSARQRDLAAEEEAAAEDTRALQPVEAEPPRTRRKQSKTRPATEPAGRPRGAEEVAGG